MSDHLLTKIDLKFVELGYKVIYSHNYNDILYVPDNPYNPNDLPFVTIWVDSKEVMVNENDNKLAFIPFELIKLIHKKIKELE